MSDLWFVVEAVSCAPAPSPPNSPTFLQQFGPVLAACIALVGVGVSLIATARRDSTRFRLEREDDYRREQREALSAVMVAAQTYRRAAGALGRPDSWMASGYDRATVLADKADEAMAALLNELTVARLLIVNANLQAALDGMFLQWRTTSQLVVELVAAFWAQDPQTMTARAEMLDSAWAEFGDAAAVLQSVALDELRPTVASD